MGGVSLHLSSQLPPWEAETFFLEIGKVYAETLTAVFTGCPYAHAQQLWHHTEIIFLQTLPAAAEFLSQWHCLTAFNGIITYMDWWGTEAWLSFRENTYLQIILEKNNKKNASPTVI